MFLKYVATNEDVPEGFRDEGDRIKLMGNTLAHETGHRLGLTGEHLIETHPTGPNKDIRASEGHARKALENYLVGPASRRVGKLVKMAEEYEVDGAIHFATPACIRNNPTPTHPPSRKASASMPACKAQ